MQHILHIVRAGWWRKLIHMFLSLVLMWCGVHFGARVLFVLLAALFVVFIFVRICRGAKDGYGEFFFILGVLVSALLFLEQQPTAFHIGMMVLAFADTAANIFGTYFGRHYYRVWGEERSIEGNIACAVVSTMIFVLYGVPYTLAFFAGVYVAIAETLAARGSDNVAIPVIAGALARVFLP